jgi:hypothetical protein
MRNLSLLSLVAACISVNLIAGCGSGINIIPTVAAPTVAPNTLTFTAARGTQSAVQSINVVASDGDAITTKLMNGNQFAIAGAGSCAQNFSSCQIGVLFEPTATGTFNDRLVVTDTVTGLSASVPLSGLPLYAAPTVSSASLNFGNEEIGLTSSTQSLTISSQYLDPLSVAFQPALDFSLTTGASCSQGASSCQIGLAFNPAQTGAITGTLIVTDPVVELSTSVALNGTGLGAAGAMSGLDYWLPFTDNSGTTVSDASGNHRDGIISGPGNPAVWAASVGLQPNDQMITIPNASGRPVRGLCAYFPAAQSGNTQYNYLYSFAVGQDNGQAFDSFYGPGDEGHGTDADFPAIGFSNGATMTDSLQGFSGIHCEEEIVGTSANDPDHIVVDGHEVPYESQSFSVAEVNSAGLTAPMMMSSNTVGTTQKGPVFYSVWGAAAEDTVEQAKARTMSELARLTSLGVAVVPPPSSAADSTCSITGTSIDQGFLASHPPSDLLALNFPCTIDNFAVSGQPPKDMAGAVQDREATVYHVKAPRNIAYNGGPTNGVINYLETAANAYQDVVDWNTKVHALGYKSIASTMMSRCQVGSHGYTGDQLKQQFNALLLANADLFDWVANQAAAPQLGADDACANPVYFADASLGVGTHLTDFGQQYYVAAERAAFEGVYQTSSTNISGPYTQIPSDTNILATGSAPYTITLMDANTANFNKKGTLCISNLGTAVITLATTNGETVNGAATFPLAGGASQCVRAAVSDPVKGGASWTVAP